MQNGINRIIDANINRAKEGLRVSEEIARFILNSRCLTEGLKGARHKIAAIAGSISAWKGVISGRQSLSDAGRYVYLNELQRRNVEDIFFANIQRVKESLRVLEEFAKLSKTPAAKGFKNIRYEIYETEKKAAKKIAALCNT